MPETLDPLASGSLAQGWLAIPAPLRRRLALASTGWKHLARTGFACLESARAETDAAQRQRLGTLAADLLLWAFGENPLHGPLAAEILAASQDPKGLPLPDASRAALAAVAANWRLPASGEAGRGSGLAYFERLAARRDTPKLADFLAAQVAKDASGLYWREKALGLALYAGQAEPAAGRMLESAALSGLASVAALKPVAQVLDAQAAFLAGETARCLAELSALPPVFGPAFGPARAGLALLAAGDDTAALPHVRAALSAAPWQANLAQAAADAASGLRRATVPIPGPAVVLLYTWNKAADLDATLASLFASELSVAGGGRARVLVLDNGSTDATPQVLDAWAERAGAQLLRVTLPVNIGAPAARNWLAALPEARAAETLVYLDDDVDLPGDWLGKLGAALAAHPDAGVVGCKVADHQAPHLLQNVAGHLVVPPEIPEDRPDLDLQSLTPNPFRLLDAHLQGPDWGLFDFVSPCASVTGCCHMFRREAFDAVGDFSLALGPSQYDDFERDLRMLAAGRHAVYQGHLRVRHRKRSGIASQGGEASANANGNRYKMQTLHSRAEIAGFLDAQALRLDQTVAQALADLDAARHNGEKP